MIKLKKSYDLYGKPDIRILLICIAAKNDCRLEFRERGRVTLVGEPAVVKDTSAIFLHIWSKMLFKQAVESTKFPEMDIKTFETDFTNGFVSRARFYLMGTGYKFRTLNNSSATLAGGNFADQFFQQLLVSNG